MRHLPLSVRRQRQTRQDYAIVVSVFYSVMQVPASYCARHLTAISLALVTTWVAIHGADINRALRRQLRGQALVIRTAAFVALCAAGYGWLGVQLAGWLRGGLELVPFHWRPIALLGLFFALGLLAERKHHV